MARPIRKVAVLGSGVMGSGIAAHFANAGIPVTLLDIVPRLTDDERAAGLDESSPAHRNRLATEAIESCKKGKPTPAYYHGSAAHLITPGNFEDHWDSLADADWIIEVVIERLDIKRDVFQRIAQVRKPTAIVSSNTSGLSAKAMTEGLDESFRQHFLVTHFFNPVRHMRLLEVVALPETDGQVVRDVAELGSMLVGKGVVYAKDTPNFIANRIGIQSTLDSFRHVQEGGFSVEEVDAIFGPALARPKSASFKTGDLVGIDTLLLVCEHVLASCKDDAELASLEVPNFLRQMVDKGLLGNKTRKGFYTRHRDANGKSVRMVLDLETLEYREAVRPKFDAVTAAKRIPDPRERFRSTVNFDDRAGRLAWATMSSMMVYAANHLLEIADDVVNVDRAMRWGFNWEIGPFESWDAVGVSVVRERLQQEGRQIPAIIERMLAAGAESFYRGEGATTEYWDPREERYVTLAIPSSELPLSAIRSREGGVVRRNPGADLLDLGDGVLGLEFHSKMNALDDDILAQTEHALELLETTGDWSGLVVTNEGEQFCVGANIMAVAMAAMAQDWDTIGNLLQSLQQLTMRMKYSQRPVVVAPFGMALGGGCEVMLAGQRVQAHAELYAGLVELGVGLIPAGGGCKELVARFTRCTHEGDGTDRQLSIQRVFELIGQAQVSSSAAEARARGFLTAADGISADRARLTADAKAVALHMAALGTPTPVPTPIPVVGRTGYGALLAGIQGFVNGGFISEYDAHIGRKLAHIITGGDLPAGALVSEQHLLDLEREAFLSLCGEGKTLERIQHMLTTGKPLRN